MHKRTTINIWFYIVLIFAVLLSIKSCVGRNNDSDVIYNLKTSRFSSYGNRTLERAAKDSLTDLQWSCSEEPISIDGGFIYEATLSGYSEEYDLNISVGFTVKFGYTLQEHDPVPVTISIIWTKVGDIYSEDTNDISYVMDYIYGNLLPNEQPLAVPTESLQTEATQSTVENEDVLPENIQYLSCQVDDLLNELDQNALRASKTYNGQYLLLTGKIYSFSADGNSFSLTGLNDDGTQFSTLIYCMIPDSEQVDELLTANVGDKIVIKCAVTVIDQFTGYTVDTISIESVIKAEEAPIQETEQTFPTEPPVVETLTGTVLRSAGELNVRSGPGTNYGAIGRLYGGETVTIYEQQDVNGTVWGNIGYGWVSMDYIVFGVDNSVAPETNNVSGMDAYCGTWQSNRCSLTITKSGDRLHMEAYWGNSAFSTNYWQMIGEYDRGADAVYYWNGVSKELFTAEDGSQQENIRYTNGEGCLVLRDGYITWMDATERATDDCLFERLPN